MAPIIPDPKKIKAFKNQAAFAAWLSKNHARESEIWLKVYKKHSGVPSVTCPEALDVALCWGWIDAIRKALDEKSFLQRYTPRRAKSIWSQINRDHVARLTKAGVMKPPGQAQVAAAQDVPDTWQDEPVCAGVSDQQHEDAGRPRQKDRGPGRDARARRDDRARKAPQVIDLAIPAFNWFPEGGWPFATGFVPPPDADRALHHARA